MTDEYDYSLTEVEWEALNLAAIGYRTRSWATKCDPLALLVSDPGSLAVTMALDSVSPLVPPTVEQIVRERVAAALREAADRMPAFHDRDVPEWAITSACKWLRGRADAVSSPARGPEVVTKTSGEAVDLLAALQRSLNAAKSARPVSSPGGTTPTTDPSPTGRGNTEGDWDDQHTRIHPEEVRRAPQGVDHGGLHLGSGVPDHPGPDPQGRGAVQPGRVTNDGPRGSDSGTVNSLTCTTCDHTGLIDWMIESDPNCYQEPDADGKVACPDCTPLYPPGQTAGGEG